MKTTINNTTIVEIYSTNFQQGVKFYNLILTDKQIGITSRIEVSSYVFDECFSNYFNNL